MRLIETDAVIIGAGPVGLFQAFQLGLQDIRCHIVDALPHIGGQCQELYADKPIYDIPGIAVCSGTELIDRLHQQVQPFQPTLHLGQLVSACALQADGRFAIGTSVGTQFLSKTVFIAAGVGAFQQRQLVVDGAAELQGTCINYGLPIPNLAHADHSDSPSKSPPYSEIEHLSAKHVWVIGSDTQAISAALALVQATPLPQSVTLMHRRDVFDAPADMVQRMREAVASGKLRLQIGQLTGVQSHDGVLQSITVATLAGETLEKPAHHLLAYLGISPKLGPIAHWGLAMQRKQLEVNTENFSTSTRGIYAVGDINTYPGKKKLILCGFHEATLAAFGAADLVYPHRKTPLQYTTTSPALHRLLGVAG